MKNKWLLNEKGEIEVGDLDLKKLMLKSVGAEKCNYCGRVVLKWEKNHYGKIWCESCAGDHFEDIEIERLLEK